MNLEATTESKTCPRCAETIKAAAKVCPFCQSRLSWLGLWRYELTVAGCSLLLVALAVAALAWLAPDEPGVQGRSFAGHRDDLIVQRMALERGEKRPEFWLSGFVTNRGAYPWRVREIELRFLNPDGSLLDVRHPRVDSPFVVQPTRESAFRFALGRLPLAVSSTRLQARVQSATDGDRPYDPEDSTR